MSTLARHISIDLSNTDGDSDYEEIEPNKYVKDGFIVSDDEDIDDIDDIDESGHGDLMTNKIAMKAIDERSDELWYGLLRKQAAQWVSAGKSKRERKELVYKLGQFKTNRGKTEYAASIQQEFGLCT